MADFSSGVSGYIKGAATVTVNFPIDMRGHADVCCGQCPYHSRYDRVCRLNGEIVAYPEKYIGQRCPLTFEDEQEGEDNV